MRVVFLAAALFAGLLTCPTVRAQNPFQPGYMVLTRGDTLRGMVQAPTRSTVARGVKFRQAPPATDKVFYPVASLRAVGITGGKSYVVRKMMPVMRHDTLRLLLETLVQGRASLYRSSYSLFTNNPNEVFANQSSLVNYYVESAGNRTRPPSLLQANTFRRDLASLFNDCVPASAVTGKFNELNIIKLVKKYNNCFIHPAQSR